MHLQQLKLQITDLKGGKSKSTCFSDTHSVLSICFCVVRIWLHNVYKVHAICLCCCDTLISPCWMSELTLITAGLSIYPPVLYRTATLNAEYSFLSKPTGVSCQASPFLWIHNRWAHKVSKIRSDVCLDCDTFQTHMLLFIFDSVPQAPSLCHKFKHQMWINTLLKIVPLCVVFPAV